ncbi:Sensor kinase CckA [Andreprevotia sp. IGB-42]|uniref:response regulator n=1 Tax=Andreprevotia sp. IGB-42 TaxID=2497473 RepID=UPI00135721BB|nr:response regulator [Andreprevotia sp. IGB-42]KAF0812697.1 Sensor kinase CckA [Andreprevotia sp. IGB-42]
MSEATDTNCDSRNLQVLLIEDSPLDAELTQIMLERAGYRASYVVVDSEAGMRAALQGQPFELILSDFVLPGFSGLAALEIARLHCPDVPFIFVSGVTGEETAVDMMRRGATDYILKQRLALLPKSVERALTLVCERSRRYQAERALAASQINVQLAVASGQFGMWDYRPPTGELIWDARCKEMFGLPADAHVDLDVFTHGVHPDDRARMAQVVADTTRSPEQSECNTDYRVQLPNGQIRWVNTCGKAFFDRGICTHFVGLLMDVTERHAASAAMVRLNDVLEELVLIRTRERDRIWALSHDMLAVMRDDLTPITLNPAWSDTLDVPHDTLLAGSIYRFIDDEDIPGTQDWLRSLAEGHAAVRFKTRVHGGKGEKGRQYWLAWTVVRADGLLYCVVRDDTQERARLEELAASNQQLLSQIEQRERVEATLQKMQRLEAVGQLTAGVAHDFNNLLTVVLSNARFTERELRAFEIPDKTLQRLATISSAAQRGGKLTTQLLTFSRQQQLAPKAVNLNRMVDTMLELLRSTMGGSVQLDTALADNLWAALVDPTQIEMVILNLAINARDASDVGGTLQISTRNVTVETQAPGPGAPEPGEYVCLSVQDSGRGMSAAVLARAFEPFFTTKEVGKGSGLGLAQVYGFARQSGGGVSIDTRENVGTTVSVYLPRINAPTPEAAAEPAAMAGAQADQHMTLLVVDDDAAVREANTQQLADFGYQVIEADSGTAALALLGNNPQIDALVADFAMPGMNGAELAGEARKLRPMLPVVFVTGYVELGRLDLPNSGIVQKPYSPEQLANSVSELLKAQPATLLQ